MTAIGAAVHVVLADVDYKIALWLIVGGIPGALLGSAVSLSAARWLRPLILVLLAASAYKLIV